MANTEQELIELEKKYWQAIKDEDLETALELTDDGCIVTGAQGTGRLSKDQMKEMMEAAKWSLEDFSLIDVQVRMLTRDVAVVAYKVHEDLVVEGKPLSLDAADASTWIRKNGSWVCALHTESLIGDPFGRDKTAGASR